MTDSIRRAVEETEVRREKQIANNERRRITRQTVIRSINDSPATILTVDYTILANECIL